MRVGGERRIHVGPHLAYGTRPVAGKIPANAVLKVRAKVVSAEPGKVGDAA